MKLYMQLSHPEIWQCSCDSCKNFDQIRLRIYPEKFLNLLTLLGIDYKKEAEIYHIEKLGFRQQLYGGWYHFTGKFIKSTIEISSQFYSPNFQIMFSNKPLLLPDIMKPYQVLQLDFKATLPAAIK